MTTVAVVAAQAAAAAGGAAAMVLKSPAAGAAAEATFSAKALLEVDRDHIAGSVTGASIGPVVVVLGHFLEFYTLAAQEEQKAPAAASPHRTADAEAAAGRAAAACKAKIVMKAGGHIEGGVECGGRDAGFFEWRDEERGRRVEGEGQGRLVMVSLCLRDQGKGRKRASHQFRYGISPRHCRGHARRRGAAAPPGQRHRGRNHLQPRHYLHRLLAVLAAPLSLPCGHTHSPCALRSLAARPRGPQCNALASKRKLRLIDLPRVEDIGAHLRETRRLAALAEGVTDPLIGFALQILGGSSSPHVPWWPTANERRRHVETR